jgi:uncharacterized protein
MVIDIKKINTLDFNTDVAVGVGLPIGTTNKFYLNYETSEQVKDNLRNLLLTIKGERVFNPRFGCNLYNKLFDPNTTQLTDSIESDIKQSVSEFMPFINLQSIEINSDNNTVIIKVPYSVPDFKFQDILIVSVDRG